MGYNYTLNGQEFGASSNAPLPAGAKVTSGTVGTGSSAKNYGSANQQAANKAALDNAVKYINSMPNASAGDFAGSGQYASGLQTALSSNSLASSTPIPVPPAPTPTNYNGTLIGNNVGLGAVNGGLLPLGTQTQDSTKKTTETTTTNQLNQPKSLVDTLKELTGLYKAPVDTASIYEQAKAEAGIVQKQQEVSNLSARLNAITAKAQADQLSVTGQGRGIPEAIIGGQQAQISKEAAIQALPIQAQLAFAQGNLQMAEENLNTLFKIRSEDALARTNQYNKLVDMAYDTFSKAEQRQLDNIRADRATNLSILNNATDNARTLATSISSKGNIALAGQILGLKQPDPTSPTFQSDLQQYNAKVASLTGQVSSGTKTRRLDSLPTSIQNRVIALADGIKSTDIGKKYLATADSINIVNGIDPKSKNPAQHQQIVYAFAKALDTDSAVKEGEYETIKKYAQSTLSRYGKEITNALNGTGFLSEQAIKDIQATMNNTYASRKPLYDQQVSETTRIINNIAGMDIASELITDYSAGINTKLPSGNINDPLGIL